MNPIAAFTHRPFLILNSQFLIKVAASLALASSLTAAEPNPNPPAATDGWRPLFNGKDLSGWVPVQVAPSG